MIGEEDKLHYVLIKDFNTFVYDHVLRQGRKHFVPSFHRILSTAEIINGKQMIRGLF